MQYTSVGYSEFMGLPMQQHEFAVPAISLLLSTIKPKRILEIGTGTGSLTILMAFGVPDILSFDITDRRVRPDLFTTMGIKFMHSDIFDHLGLAREYIEKEGCTLVMCDGGNKPREFGTLSKYLKKGDVIMGHDYSQNPNNWPWSEITSADIPSGAGLEPFLYEELRRIAWLCCRKVA